MGVLGKDVNVYLLWTTEVPKRLKNCLNIEMKAIHSSSHVYISILCGSTDVYRTVFKTDFSRISTIYVHKS